MVCLPLLIYCQGVPSFTTLIFHDHSWPKITQIHNLSAMNRQQLCTFSDSPQLLATEKRLLLLRQLESAQLRQHQLARCTSILDVRNVKIIRLWIHEQTIKATRHKWTENDASARLSNLTLASCDLDFWPPDPQSWPFMPLFCGPLVTTGIKISSFVFELSCSQLCNRRTKGRTDKRMDR